MPELPEVEVVRRGLDAHVVGRRIEAVEVFHPRPVRRHLAGPEDLVARLRGQVVTGARRRGKYLWLPLERGDALLAHLGMSGQLLVQAADRPDDRHLRVRFDLSRLPGDPDAGWQLRFVDQRMFGGLAVSSGGAQSPAEISHIARDPLDPEFDQAAFVRRVRTRASGVKRILLDQTVVSGIGNIYADESLWRARVHGERPGSRLRVAQVEAVLAGVREVMGAALAQGGTSFDSLYVNVNGESGYFSRSLAVYGQQGRPCPRCGTAVVRAPFMNRSSFFCPTCQVRPRAPRGAAPGAAARPSRSGRARD